MYREDWNLVSLRVSVLNGEVRSYAPLVLFCINKIYASHSRKGCLVNDINVVNLMHVLGCPCTVGPCTWLVLNCYCQLVSSNYVYGLWHRFRKFEVVCFYFSTTKPSFGNNRWKMCTISVQFWITELAEQKFALLGANVFKLVTGIGNTFSFTPFGIHTHLELCHLYFINYNWAVKD